MSTLIIEDPLLVKREEVRNDGRLTLGQKYANEEVEVVIRRVDDEPINDDLDDEGDQ